MNKSILKIKKKSKEELNMEKIEYNQMGNYQIPNLVMEKEQIPKGKYARMRLNYLKNHKKAEYLILLMDNKLNEELTQIQEKTTKMINQIVEKMKKEQKITEEMKAQDQMLWVGMMNNIQQIAEEQVVKELIYN
ncbi:MAG: TnpV protein [Clostridia bacterium]|nr:TnpV protein [Clostridia bacterium]